MNYTINKLDRRHKGFDSFTHYIMPVWSSHLSDKLKFFEWRNWCWETFGPGMEREMAIEFRLLHDADLRWAWHTNNGAKRLYFKSEKEVAWFNLKWSSE